MVKYKQLPALSGAFASAALIAACGGGGGGGALPGPGPNPSPSPQPTSAMLGTLNVITSGTTPANATYSAAAGASVVFSCGCSVQAGVTTTDGTGNFTVGPTSTARPLAPSPTYTTIPGRNYLVVAKSGAGAEAWTLQFLGSIPAHNHYLEVSNMSDAYTAAAALYVFQNSPVGSTAYDNWDFTAVTAWVQHLQSAPNAQETTLLNDIVSESAANRTLFPGKPSWDPSQITSAKLSGDLTNVKNSIDPTLPVACGSSPCGAEPTP